MSKNPNRLSSLSRLDDRKLSSKEARDEKGESLSDPRSNRSNRIANKPWKGYVGWRAVLPQTVRHMGILEVDEAD
jgi:hypothetical protein